MNFRPALFSLAACLLLPPASALLGSDHADPMSLAAPLLKPPPQEPGITDLHVFLDNEDPAKATAMIISLCVNRSLGAVDDKDGRPLAPKIMKDGKMVRPEPPYLKPDPSPYTYRVHIDPTPDIGYDDPAAVARYGAVIRNPGSITDPIQIEFKLNYHDEANPSGRITLVPGSFKTCGLAIPGEPAVATREAFRDGKGTFQPGRVNLCPGIFDDPFIFPRFFRTNVIGMVMSIPLSAFPSNPRQFLIWATTHGAKGQIDHVGRSLRTQLPRFGALNTLPPSDHVRELQRIHEDPTILEDTLRTFVSPLFARRYYDGVPDVMVLNFDRPIRFPNGRLLTDDVSKLLADTGETILLELSYTDSTYFPRATENDGDARRINKANPGMSQPFKVFKTSFPYLADPWTDSEVTEYPRNGMLPGPPKLTAKTENKVLLILAALLLLGLVAALVFIWIGWRLGRGIQGGAAYANEGIGIDDTQYQGSSFSQVWQNVSSHPYLERWEKPGALPVYSTTLYSVLRGIIPGGKPYAFFSAQRRTLASHADLRGGADGKGYRRLLHPNGICLKGTWNIDAATSTAEPFTGVFAPGSHALIIGRYSTCCTETRSGHNRSLSLVGKVYNTNDENQVLVPANFFTQEDFGGTRSSSIKDVILCNAPNTTPWRRGLGLPVFIVTFFSFLFSDKRPTVRQLYQLAELGKPAGAKTRTPRYMRLILSSKIAGGNNLDFRDQILAHFAGSGTNGAAPTLEFDIEVADDARFRWFGTRVDISNWTRIGSIRFESAAASYNGDHVIHYQHPVWRNNPDDPDTVARKHAKL
jgi:hypothetical protein